MRLPGDPSPRAAEARMIRVDHAGEYGAVRIYQGQRAVLGRGAAGPMLDHMQAQEEAHHDTARAAGAAGAPGYRLLTAAIRAGCRVAIAASEVL